MSAEGLARFAEIVVTDSGLRRELLGPRHRAQFVSLVVARARAAGCDVHPDDVEEGLRARRQTWHERWL